MGTSCSLATVIVVEEKVFAIAEFGIITIGDDIHNPTIGAIKDFDQQCFKLERPTSLNVRILDRNGARKSPSTLAEKITAAEKSINDIIG